MWFPITYLLMHLNNAVLGPISTPQRLDLYQVHLGLYNTPLKLARLSP